MDRDDLAFAGVARQAELIRAGDVTSRELVILYLERIERIDPQLNAFRKVMDERSLVDAQPKRTNRGAARLLESSALPRNATVTLSRPLDARSRRVDLKASALRYLQAVEILARRVATVRLPRLTRIDTLPLQASAGLTPGGRARRPVKRL